MKTPLEHVHYKTWLQKGDCNIFLIGETHNLRNYKCNGIYEMFQKLLKDFIKHKTPEVDIMLEITEDEVPFYTNSPFTIKYKQYNKGKEQILNVRGLLSKCIANKNCPFKVHWTDANEMISSSRLPKWIKELHVNNVRKSSESSKINKLLIRYKSLFTREDMMKILTEHDVILKEIEKAHKVDSLFTLDFAKSMFMDLITMYYERDHNYSHGEPIFILSRRVIDIYTAARIVAKQMKNVIVYEGRNHIKALLYIFYHLGYTVKMSRNDNICV